MRESADGTVTMARLSERGLSHKAASRVSELNAQGYHIMYIYAESWGESKYKLLVDVDKKGQLEILVHRRS